MEGMYMKIKHVILLLAVIMSAACVNLSYAAASDPVATDERDGAYLYVTVD
jgi:hypothetical protein